jgi:hypothetical protein
VNDLAGLEFPGMDVTFVAAFRPARSPGTTTRDGWAVVSPRLRPDGTVLIQLDRRVKDSTPFEDLEKELTRDYEASERGEPEATLRLARRLLSTRPEFDRERKRFTARGTVGRPGDVSTTVSVGRLSPNGLLILHGFTRPGGSEADLAVIQKMVESFRSDEPPAPPPSFLDRIFGDRVGPTGRMAIVGVVIALLVVAVGAVFLREKPARGRSDGHPWS